MTTIDKLIFNRLARREGVNLPGIGSLEVAFRPASRSGRRIDPPVNRAFFSRRENPEWISLPALIEQETAVDAETAQKDYENWLAATRRKDGTVVIAGTGEIVDGVFTPSPELKSALDRGLADSPVRVRERRKTFKITILFIFMAVVAFLTALVLLRPDTVSRVKDLLKITSCKSDRKAAVTTDSARLAVVLGDTAEKDRVGQAEIPSTAHSPQVADSTSTASESVVYHLVAGVFSTQENADRFIAESKRKGETFPYRKVAMNNGRILVSIFASPDKSETDRRRHEMRSAAPDLWIYVDTDSRGVSAN